MVNKTLKLSEQQLQHYVQLEQSIEHWSKEYTKVQLQADRLKGAVEGMYNARMQMVNGALRDQKLDPAHVHQVNVNTDDGQMTVVYDDSVPNPAADPAEPGAVAPSAQPIPSGP